MKKPYYHLPDDIPAAMRRLIDIIFSRAWTQEEANELLAWRGLLPDGDQENFFYDALNYDQQELEHHRQRLDRLDLLESIATGRPRRR